MPRLTSRPLSRTGSPTSSTASSVAMTGLEDCTLEELEQRLGLYCANIRYLNPYPDRTEAELAAWHAASERLADLRRKDPTTRLFIQAARWNRWIDPKGVEHRFAAGGPGQAGFPPREKQDTSLGLPKSEGEYRRLLEAKRAAQLAPVSVISPPSPAAGPLPSYPDSSLTTLTIPQQPGSSAVRGRSPPPSNAASTTSSARTAHKRRTSLSPVTAMKTIVPEWTTDGHDGAGPTRGVEDGRPRSAGSSSGSSSTQSALAFPVVKTKVGGRSGKQRHAGPLPDQASPVDKSTKRKSKRDPAPPAPSDQKGKGRVPRTGALPLAPPIRDVLDELPWEEDDSVEIAAGKGATHRQKMRVNPAGWEGIEDISACAEFLPLSFPSDLATSTPVPNKRRPPPILRPITARAPSPSAATDDRIGGQQSLSKPESPSGRSKRVGSKAVSRGTANGRQTSAAEAQHLHRPLPMTTTATEPGTPASDSPSSHSLPTPPKRRQHLLSRSSMLGATSSDSQLGSGGGAPASSLAKMSADESLPFSLGFSQVDRRVDEVRKFLEAEGEGIDESWD